MATAATIRRWAGVRSGGVIAVKECTVTSSGRCAGRLPVRSGRGRSCGQPVASRLSSGRAAVAGGSWRAVPGDTPTLPVVEVRVLGPLQVVDDGRAVELGLKERVLLARL